MKTGGYSTENVETLVIPIADHASVFVDGVAPTLAGQQLVFEMVETPTTLPNGDIEYKLMLRTLTTPLT